MLSINISLLFQMILIFIDFQKAFDTLEWDFLLKCLEAFNFGHDFMHWVRLFYKNIQSCVINNGTASDYFTLKRGVRQGDPLSPYLFVLAVETLAIAIRNNVQIKGIKIGNEVERLSTVELECSCLKLGGTELRSPVHDKKLLPSISLAILLKEVKLSISK